MENEPILVDKQDMIGLITLNRPEEMNTFNVPFAGKLNDALRDMDQDDEIRVVVIQASGKHFSTGISLSEFKDKSHKDYREFIKLMDEHNHTIARMKKPVIASVKGYALANGAGLVFACDLAVAAEDAKFGTTAINVGLICLGPAVPLVRSLGRKKGTHKQSGAAGRAGGVHNETCRQAGKEKSPGASDREDRYLRHVRSSIPSIHRLHGRVVCCTLRDRRCPGRGNGLCGKKETRMEGEIIFYLNIA